MRLLIVVNVQKLLCSCDPSHCQHFSGPCNVLLRLSYRKSRIDWLIFLYFIDYTGQYVMLLKSLRWIRWSFVTNDGNFIIAPLSGVVSDWCVYHVLWAQVQFVLTRWHVKICVAFLEVKLLKSSKTDNYFSYCFTFVEINSFTCWGLSPIQLPICPKIFCTSL